ncbi:MAG: hypothetical protein ACOH2V_03990 [Candidatus Saccharimonadaceae bacterium]
MSNFKLNLPTDIPWERICVTEDMIDPEVCDNRLPAKWQTSMAVFKYVPEDDYQLFPKYKISYLKVTATITGYQPLDKEIQGKIDWDGVDVSTIPGLTDLLNSYNPCHGAILQVVVGPHSNRPNIELKDYPFFMDFEPKKRELYELATDTKEKQSRSIESLNITKSAGSSQSLEILDVDMGGGGFGAQASYAGTGGGFNYTAPNGQWGTKRLNADESLSSRTSDVGQEKRETFSYTTQISQMYHLLDSYHLGTNRIVFFIQPRPHTLEEPSGFVRGPRPVDGIQEFFMVVAQLKEQDDFCVSLRLDTSHLTTTPTMEYERKVEYSDSALVTANLPTNQDNMVERKVRWHVNYGFFTDDIYYKHFVKKVIVDIVYPVPEGFRIESYSDVVNSNQNGYSSVTPSPDGRSLTIHAEANSSIWFQDEGDGACIDNCPPDVLDQITGRVERILQVNLISLEQTKKVGEEDALMITTRGLCCCDNTDVVNPTDELVVGVLRVPNDLSFSRYLKSTSSSEKYRRGNVAIKPEHENKTDKQGISKDCTEKNSQDYSHNYDSKFAIRLANELSDFIKTESIKSLNNPNVKLQKFVDTDFFTKQLEYKMIQFKNGRKILNESIVADLPNETLLKLEKYFNKSAKEITRQDLLSIRNESLAKITGLKADQIQKVKLSSLGVKFNPEKPKDEKKENHPNKKS